MKKRDKSNISQGPSTKLYKDGLEEVISILKKHCKSVTIEDDAYEYESLEELEKNRGKTLNQIEIKGSFPFVHLEIKRGLAGRLTVYRTGENSEEPFHLVHNLVKEHKRRWLLIIFHPILSFLYWIAWTSSFFIFRRYIDPVISDTIQIVLIIIFMFAIAWVSLCTYIGGFSYISLNRKHEQSSFWIRNKDTVWVGTIVAVVTAFITWLITYLTTKPCP